MKTWDFTRSNGPTNLKLKGKRPPFKWAGGKDRMFNRYNHSGFFPDSDINVFVDVFAGSACVSKWVRKNNPDAVIIINDSCSELMNMFRYMQSPTYSMFEKEYLNHVNAYANFSNVESRKKYYYDLRNQYALTPNSMNPIQHAAALLYMLQTGFNGIWQTSKNFNNRYASPAGLMTWKPNGKLFDLSSVQSFAKFLDTCVITDQDFEQTQAYFGKGTWFYADPPYRKSFAQYKSTKTQEFTDEDQVRLIEFLKSASKAGSFCALSNRESFDQDYDACVDKNNHITAGWFADKFDDTWNCRFFRTKYTAGRNNSGYGSKAVEVLIRNYS